MNDSNEALERPEEGAEGGFAPAGGQHFDPLFNWETAAYLPDEDVEFLLGGSTGRRPSVFDATLQDSALGWELPPVEPFRAERVQVATGAGYPSPAPQMAPPSELQRRLQEGTVVLPRPERRWAVTVRELVETALLALLIFLAVRASFQNFRVEGASMQPSLQDGEYLIVNKLTYAGLDASIFNFLPFYEKNGDSVSHLWDAPSRGDVIVFRAPISIERDFIKRIIGLPGDTIEINEASGLVSVNGVVLTEPYINGSTSCNVSCTRVIPRANTPEALADCGSNACYFVMGDNRPNSSDSRQGWLVPEENIIGKAVVTYWKEGNLNVDLAPNHSVGITDDAAAEQ